MSRWQRLAQRPGREALLVWAGLLGLLAAARLTVGLLPYGGSLVGALAVALFLWVPGYVDRKVGREEPDYGLDFSRVGRDLWFALWVMLLFFAPFALLFRGFVAWLDSSPELIRTLTPYGRSHGFHWRLPSGLLDLVAGNIAVAAGEEWFYRGYLQRLLERAFPPQARLWGAPFGRAAWLQTLLFAAGHLLTPQPYRLMTFFPGLLFTWMAVRSGRVMPGVVAHAVSNVLIATLEASAFGGR